MDKLVMQAGEHADTKPAHNTAALPSLGALSARLRELLRKLVTGFGDDGAAFAKTVWERLGLTVTAEPDELRSALARYIVEVEKLIADLGPTS